MIYIRIAVYFITIGVTAFAFYNIDFNSFLRFNRKQFAFLVYIIISIVVGYLLGEFVIALLTLAIPSLA